MTDLQPPTQTALPVGLRPAGIALGLVALGVVLAGTLSRRAQVQSAGQWAAAQAVPGVRLITPKPAAASEDLVQPATIEAWTAAKLFARVPGYVRRWNADIGQRVRAGAALGEIDTPDLDQQIIQARASLARVRAESRLAFTTADRWRDMLATNAVSRQETDEKTANAATHAAAVREAEANLGRLLAFKAYATLRAPFAGVITLRNADIGDLVGPGAAQQQPVFALADDRRLRIYVNVPQRDAPRIHAGLAAWVEVAGLAGRRFAARVLDQSGAIDSHSGTLRVELVADNPQGVMRPGGFAQVHLQLPVPAGRVVLPASALILRSGGTRVATVDAQGRAHLVPVVIGRDMGGSVEIASGLAPHTPVIDSPPDSLGEGDPVKVVSHG